ncbi:MAG: hypothetical protein J6A01_07805, partial [Proteobacteria bacterium]|nr:hypothetical protein [Pseudomonadota bacterium]
DEALYGEKTTISLESMFYEGEDEEDSASNDSKDKEESSGGISGILGLLKKPKIVPPSDKKQS